MKLLNSDIAIPLYQQLYDLLLDQIRSGVYPSGSKIPSEEELCKTYDLSRVTVRNALGAAGGRQYSGEEAWEGDICGDAGIYGERLCQRQFYQIL